MRILIFHGYLLGGTGSNVYNARLAAALKALGHEVHLLCQDRHPEDQLFVDAVGDWDRGSLVIRELRPDPSCTVYRPSIGPLLPVYVLDRYKDIEAKTFVDCTDREIEAYLECNVAAVSEVAELVRPDLALANHLVMGPVVLARALRSLGVPYAVKVHGSALEYTVKPHPERFLVYAREGLGAAQCALVGSLHTAQSLWAAVGDAGLVDRTRLGPPGVDIAEFGPREPQAAVAGYRRLVVRLGAARASVATPADDAFARDAGAAAGALESLDPERDRLVAFTGKLIVSKGVDLLLAAWPLVVEQVAQARLVIVGFGAYRQALEDLVTALDVGDLAKVSQIAERGRELEGGRARRLEILAGFVEGLPDPTGYARAAAAARGTVVFTGRLEHAELADLLPACEAQVVPSTFPEAFGMVAAEAAACGALPVCANHSGLAEVSRTLADAVAPEARRLLSFDLGPNAIVELAGRLVSWLGAPPELRAETRRALAQVAHQRYSWEGVAEGVVAAAAGHLDGLPMP
jgi:glycosyltransferase involved in cell wall biosynthesis